MPTCPQCKHKWTVPKRAKTVPVTDGIVVSWWTHRDGNCINRESNSYCSISDFMSARAEYAVCQVCLWDEQCGKVGAYKELTRRDVFSDDWPYRERIGIDAALAQIHARHGYIPIKGGE